MSEMPLTVAYIPARSGSTRLPNKNILPLGGHPLLAYSIRTALLTPGIDMVVVDTDDENYAAIAREYGATVPFLRPAELAGKDSSLVDAWTVFQGRFEAQFGPISKVVRMLASSPFRSVDMVRRLLGMLDRYFKVTTVFQADFNLEDVCIEYKDGLATMQDHVWLRFTPDLRWIKPLSNVSCSWVPVNDNPLCRYNNFAYYFLTNPIEVVDIDFQEDFDCAREIVENRLYDFGGSLWQE